MANLARYKQASQLADVLARRREKEMEVEEVEEVDEDVCIHDFVVKDGLDKDLPFLCKDCDERLKYHPLDAKAKAPASPKVAPRPATKSELERAVEALSQGACTLAEAASHATVSTEQMSKTFMNLKCIPQPIIVERHTIGSTISKPVVIGHKTPRTSTPLEVDNYFKSIFSKNKRYLEPYWSISVKQAIDSARMYAASGDRPRFFAVLFPDLTTMDTVVGLDGKITIDVTFLDGSSQKIVALYRCDY